MTEKHSVRQIALGLLAILFLFPAASFGQPYSFSAEDEAFLDKVQKKGFEYFLYEHNPKTGLVKDKADNFRRDTTQVASIAATGFGLTAMCVGAERGWISKSQARAYCTKTLRFFLDEMTHEHGFFYHFVRWNTGSKNNHTELSSIDTALFLAGALLAGEYFKGTEVETLAAEIYERVDFKWMLNGGTTLSMGWDPRQGFLRSRWNHYSESLILYVLAAGSPTHPVPKDSWKRVRKTVGVYGPHVLIACPPLFTHQYSAVWLDLKNKNDGFADYFKNSTTATLVNREFCLDQRQRFKTYSENIWGLTASESPDGYKAYGAEPGGAIHDGTVAPTAAGSSIVFTPELSLAALKAMYESYKNKIWGKYGFSDAFNADRGWYSQNVLGIDQGPLVLMIENARSGFVWKYFMKNPSVQKGLERLGFKEGSISLKRPKQPVLTIAKAGVIPDIDGDLADWDFSKSLRLAPANHLEVGEISDDADGLAEIALVYDAKYLYLASRVADESLVTRMKGDKIWRNDCLELFISPRGGELQWKNPKDIQLGLSLSEWEHEGKSWAWFQGLDPAEKGLELKITRRADGYDLEAKIPWSFLMIAPRPGLSFGFTPALHDMDSDGSDGKLSWFYLPNGKTGNVILGRAVLGEDTATSSGAQSL